MPRPIITLLTDFGSSDSYVAQMKGVLLSRCPDCHLVDVTHHVPPQDVRRASQLLWETVPRFPQGTVHLAVVDPGVGTARKIIATELQGQRLVLPDNGLITQLWREAANGVLRSVDNAALWSSAVSSTFHGRDIIAPVAAFLAAGGDLAEVGSPLDRPLLLEPVAIGQATADGSWSCPIESIDHYGNVMLSCPGLLDQLKPGRRVIWELEDASRMIVPVVATYGDARRGSTILLRDSQGRLELAVVQGSAAQLHSLKVAGNVKIWLQ